VAYSLVVIQSDTSQAQELADLFFTYGFDILAVGNSGKDALELARRHQPDALLLDPFMPFYNCDEVAEFLERDLPQTVKIAIADDKNDLMADRFMQSGGDLFLVRPLEISACRNRIEKHLKIRKQMLETPSTNNLHRASIRAMQMQLKMPVSISGFGYIREAVEIVLESPSALNHITTEVYAPIAVTQGSTPQRVERCIRTAVEKTFERGDLELLQKYFFPSASDKGKISNKEFIGIFAELIRKGKDL
jgi:two-component system response regulator (stage 0 sporulation protein A)